MAASGRKHHDGIINPIKVKVRVMVGVRAGVNAACTSMGVYIDG
jgi:hypothetical protein